MKSFYKIIFCYIFFIALCCLSNIVYALTPAEQKIISQVDPGLASQRLRMHTTPMIKPILEKPAIEKEKVVIKEEEKKFKLTKIIIEGVTVFTEKDLLPLYQAFLDKEVTFSDLTKIADAITVKYRQHGYIISRAIIPAQAIKKGEVRIKVIEGFIGRVNVSGKGNANGAEALVKVYGEKLQGLWPPLQMKQIERYILLSNDLPGIQARSVLSPSTSIPEATDLTLEVEQTKFQGGVDFNNYGTKYLGPHQIAATLQTNELTNTADQLGLRVMATPNNNTMRFLQAFYNRPIGSDGLLLTLEGDITRTKPDFKLSYLELAGKSNSFRVKLSYPVIRSRLNNLILQANFKYLDSRTDYALDNLYSDKIRSLRIGADYSFLDPWSGYNYISAQLSKGLNILGAGQQNLTQTTPSRPGGKSSYTKIDMLASHTHQFGPRFSVLVAMNAQYSPDSLLSAEEFGFGGREFGRGYDPSELIGDKGIAGKAELRFNTYPDYQFLRFMQYYTFYDIGKIWNVGTQNDQTPSESASSTGIGVRVNFTNHIACDLEISKPLTHQVQTIEDDEKNGKSFRGFFNISAFL